ncbi:MAG: hypothetical protein JST82_11645 [Bacteroidetes bacterium]|nr:hypothetical protein [Bacteroidota bacterium]
MKRIAFLIAIMSTVVLTNNAMAQSRMPRVTHRQINQHERIRQGVRSGELTRHETRVVRMQQAKIAHDKRFVKRDGIITPHERRVLAMEQNHANRTIYRMKHNNRNYR